MGTLDLAGLHAYKRNARSIAVKAVQDTTLVMEREAKRLAPVRKVYGDNPTVNTFQTTRLSRQAFRTVSKTEKGNKETDVFARGNFRRFTQLNALSSRGRAELRRGIKSYEQGTETSVIEIDVRNRNVELFRPVGSVHRFDASRGGKKTFHLQLGGRLRRDIEARGTTYRGGYISGGVDSLAPYSRYVEFMTKRTRAQPFMRPAFKANRNLLKANLKAGFRGEG